MARSASTVLLFLVVLAGCDSRAPAPASGTPSTAPASPSSISWAIAVHGGAGVISRDTPEPERTGYVVSLEGALRLGREILDGGGSSLDAVERVIRLLEDDPRFNAGRGAVFNHEGGHELDASIMDGRDLSCGAVAGVRTVRHPISLARLVMERTRHVLLQGEGAEGFAASMEVERVDPRWFGTDRRKRQLERALERERAEHEHGTVGVVALDRRGNLAAGTSTGGLTNKQFGRVGDSPIIGAGTYADNRSCALSASGKGEEFIRHNVTAVISAGMRHEGLSLAEAAERVVHGDLAPGDGGIIGVSRTGEIAMVFNTPGMYRGAADSSGFFEVRIWD